MTAGIVALIILFLAFLSLLVSKKISRKLALKNRSPISLEEIYSSVKGYDVRYETFEKIFKAIGEFYSVDPGLLRPTDSIKMLFGIDSWDLDAGTEKMEKWLKETFNTKGRGEKISTLLDLLIIVDASKKIQF